MNWLRSKAKRLSLLALFALALQLGLSFGHTHLDRAFASAATISSSAISNPAPDTGRDPEGRNDICAICATIALANALIGAAPPLLPLPVEVVSSDILPAPSAKTGGPLSVGFQSRAPPQS